MPVLIEAECKAAHECGLKLPSLLLVVLLSQCIQVHGAPQGTADELECDGTY
jgi:hypothetical protein